MLAVLIASGCVWRGDTADHYIGPLLFGTQRFPARVASINEQVHFPALIESGRQWGFSLGVIRRVTATPRVVDGDQPTGDRSSAKSPRSFFSIPITESLAVSPFYLRIDLQTSSEFIIRSLVGFQGSIGDEGNFLSAGLSTTRQFTPRQEGAYLLCHDSHVPLEMTFIVYKNQSGFSPTPC